MWDLCVVRWLVLKMQVMPNPQWNTSIPCLWRCGRFHIPIGLHARRASVYPPSTRPVEEPSMEGGRLGRGKGRRGWEREEEKEKSNRK